MRKLTTLVLLMMGVVTMMAQDPMYELGHENEKMQKKQTQSDGDNFFDTEDFDKAVKNFCEINGLADSRAKKIMELGRMSDDGAIQWQFVIEAKNTIDADAFFECLERWQDMTFTKESAVKNKSENLVEFEYQMKMAEVTGYLSFSIIYGIKNIKVELRENRFRVTGSVLHYKLGTMSGLKVYIPGEVSPFVKTKNKQSLTMAYVNGNVQMVNRLQNLVEYIKQNYNKVEEKVNTEEDW